MAQVDGGGQDTVRDACFCWCQVAADTKTTGLIEAIIYSICIRSYQFPPRKNR